MLYLRHKESMELDQGWKQWLDENLKRGCEKKDLLHHMVIAGIKEATARDVLRIGIDEFKLYPYSKIPTDQLLAPNVTVLGSKDTRVYMLDGFLSKETCDTLMRLSQTKLKPSTTTTQVKNFRTSQTHHFDGSHPVYQEVDDKICTFMNLSETLAETTQVQRYLVGNQFKEHTDWFEPSADEWKCAGKRGQRTWTVTVYLNDVDEGGETHFSRLNLRMKPKTGRAVIWNNLLPSGAGNHDTLHEGCPVIRGRKFIITKWFRDKTQEE